MPLTATDHTLTDTPARRTAMSKHSINPADFVLDEPTTAEHVTVDVFKSTDSGLDDSAEIVSHFFALADLVRRDDHNPRDINTEDVQLLADLIDELHYSEGR